MARKADEKTKPQTSLQEITRRRVDVAMGRAEADLVIRDGKWVCVQSGEIIPHTEIAIIDGRIAYVGDSVSHTIGSSTQIIDAQDQYMSPGLLDAHMHVESGMLTVTEFVQAVIPHGTTGMFIDPHEIANVFGLRGIRLMVDEASRQPIHVWVQVPSCVPSAPGLETPGAILGPSEVAEAMKWDGIVGLGEVMNFPGVYLGDKKMHAEMAETRKAGKVIGGHYASPDLGRFFHGYVAGGPEDDHEGTRPEDVIARVRQGMKAILREGSGWCDVGRQVRALTEMGIEPRHILLCTDDSHAETLVNEGHVNRAVRQAIAQGVSPIIAIQMATLNTAEHFGLARDVGQIAPGRYADILLLDDLPEFSPSWVIARGRVLVEQGKLSGTLPVHEIPDWVKSSVHLPRPISAEDFRLLAPATREATAHVIGILENQAPTRHLVMQVPVIKGEVKADMQRDLAKIAVIERHHGTGRVQVGLVQGYGFKVPCAVASTVAHDCHHVIVVGTSETDMAFAANTLDHQGGGQVVVRDGKVIGMVELPVAGLMSVEGAELVARKANTILQGFHECGCELKNPNMQLSLSALVVIPELRLSDLGLVDVNRFTLIPVLE